LPHHTSTTLSTDTVHLVQCRVNYSTYHFIRRGQRSWARRPASRVAAWSELLRVVRCFEARERSRRVTEQDWQASSNDRRPSPALHLFFILHYSPWGLRLHFLRFLAPPCSVSAFSVQCLTEPSIPVPLADIPAGQIWTIPSLSFPSSSPFSSPDRRFPAATTPSCSYHASLLSIHYRNASLRPDEGNNFRPTCLPGSGLTGKCRALAQRWLHHWDSKQILHADDDM